MKSYNLADWHEGVENMARFVFFFFQASLSQCFVFTAWVLSVRLFVNFVSVLTTQIGQQQ
jgi:hypothetical protein